MSSSNKLAASRPPTRPSNRPPTGLAQAPAGEGKPGGVLREDLPQGFAIHESATNSVTWPAMPCYSNLVIFDQQKRIGRIDSIVPDLAERWSWQDGYRNLVFFLRRDARWHVDRFAHY